MTVAVLNPQDCLRENRLNRFSKQTLISPEMKYPRNANPNVNRTNRMQSNRRKRSPPPRPHITSPPSRASVGPTKPPSKNNLVMGQVKILKRGEELTSTASFEAPELVSKFIEKHGDPDLGSIERLGPDPKSVPTQIRLTESKNRVASFYAGSAFITSPPPSSLPLPAFFTKKSVTVKTADATTDLRRILKLDLL